MARGDRCEFKAKASVTKHDLRAQVQTLKQERLNSRAVLDALLLDKHEAIVQRLRAGEPVDAIAQSLIAQDTEDAEVDRDARDNDDDDAEDNKEGIVQDHNASTSAPTAPVDGASASQAPGVADAGRAIAHTGTRFDGNSFDLAGCATGGGALDGLPSWCVPMPMGSPAVDGFPFPNMPSAPRRHSFSASGPTARTPVLGSCTWTKVTPNKALVGHLIGLFFSWEFPPFTMVSQELFLRDYHSGGRHFCSQALVNAVASVATRYLEPDQTTSSRDAYLLGEQFFAESKALLVLDAQIPTLPSIQALALLAVREMSCGRESEAQELCLQAVRLLSALDFEDLEGHRQLTDHLTVRCMTCSGVLSLTRYVARPH